MNNPNRLALGQGKLGDDIPSPHIPVDIEVVKETLNMVIQSLRKQATVLQAMEVNPLMRMDMLAKTISLTAKTVDELGRWMEFAQGRPDSRPDTGKSLLALLTDEQLQQVLAWADGNKGREPDLIPEYTVDIPMVAPGYISEASEATYIPPDALEAKEDTMGDAEGDAEELYKILYVYGKDK